MSGCRMLIELGSLLGLHLLGLAQIQPLASSARVETLQAQQQGGVLMHQVRPAAQQITHGPQLRIVNVRLGQNVQSLQLAR